MINISWWGFVFAFIWKYCLFEERYSILPSNFWKTTARRSWRCFLLGKNWNALFFLSIICVLKKKSKFLLIEGSWKLKEHRRATQRCTAVKAKLKPIRNYSLPKKFANKAFVGSVTAVLDFHCKVSACLASLVLLLHFLKFFFLIRSDTVLKNNNKTAKNLLAWKSFAAYSFTFLKQVAYYSLYILFLQVFQWCYCLSVIQGPMWGLLWCLKWKGTREQVVPAVAMSTSLSSGLQFAIQVHTGLFHLTTFWYKEKVNGIYLITQNHKTLPH